MDAAVGDDDLVANGLCYNYRPLARMMPADLSEIHSRWHPHMAVELGVHL
jgi:hypothetical protein